MSTAEGTGTERRHSARVPMELRVEYERLNQFFADYTRNISQGGLFIRTQKPLEPGKVLTFRITVPKLEEPFVLRGSVRWVITPDQASEDDPAGMGIAFLYGSERERIAIESRIEELMVESLGPIAYEALTGQKPHS